MKYHIATSINFDFDVFLKRARTDSGPRHCLYELGQKLNATIHQPNEADIRLIDKILSKIMGEPKNWALARKLASQLDQESVLYCPGEDVGIPVALLFMLKSRKPKLISSLMAPKRPRPRLLLRFFQLQKVISIFLTNTQLKADYIKSLLNLKDNRVLVLREQTDAQFFRPAPLALSEHPTIVSAGLEQRDYITLAEATKNLDVNVKVCAVSPNYSDKQRTAIPDSLPKNMEMRHYEWVELRQLYQKSRVTVISLLQNDYSAGLTVMMEAMACARPVIISRTSGLAETMIDKGLVVGVEVGDVAGLKASIQHLLDNPEKAEAMAQRAHEYFLANHKSDIHVEELANCIGSMSGLQVRAETVENIAVKAP